MQFSPDQIKDFKNLYLNKFNIELSDSEAIDQLSKLVELVKIVYQPITIDQYLETKLTKINIYGNTKI